MRKIFLLLSLMIFFPTFDLVAFQAKVQRGLSDEELLETISRHSFDYFLLESHPKSGLVRDRAHNYKRGAKESPASIAATGFALTAYGVGVARDWIDYGNAHQRTRQILKFMLHTAPQENGFFYHFMDPETGKRAYRSEISPVDTALFLAGALFAAEFYQDSSIRDLVMQIYERVNWPWMLNGGKTFSMAWSPEKGFDQRRWDHYSELMIMYLLAMGSPTSPVSPSSWDEIARPVGSYGGYRLIQMPPLFTHQYSHIWIDFRGKHDSYADYFQNSVNATLANRAFVINEAARYSTYGPHSWGLTACDGPVGYQAYGAPPGWAVHDGTIAPTGCGSSIVFTPKESIDCLRYIYENLGDRLWGEYGFSDSYNLDKDWFSKDVIGINQGALLLMIENYRTGMIWSVMDKNIHLQRAMKAAGFRTGSQELPWPDPPQYPAFFTGGAIQIDGYMNDWPNRKPLVLNLSNKEVGLFGEEGDLEARFWFGWDEQRLYFLVRVMDDDIITRKTGKNIWQDDIVELFIDPKGDGLLWNGSEDFQIGFRVQPDSSDVKTWSWFQGGEDPSEKGYVTARGYLDKQEYIIEGAVQWDYLGVRPHEGSLLCLSPAIHDIDQDRSQGKYNWFFRNEKGHHRFNLGRIVLEGSQEKP